MKSILCLICVSTLALMTGCGTISGMSANAINAQVTAANAFYAANGDGYWLDQGRTEVIRIKNMQFIPFDATKESELILYVPRDYRQPIQYKAAQGVIQSIMDGLSKLAPWAFGFLAVDRLAGNNTTQVVQPESSRISGLGSAQAPILPLATP